MPSVLKDEFLIVFIYIIYIYVCHFILFSQNLIMIDFEIFSFSGKKNNYKHAWDFSIMYADHENCNCNFFFRRKQCVCFRHVATGGRGGAAQQRFFLKFTSKNWINMELLPPPPTLLWDHEKYWFENINPSPTD